MGNRKQPPCARENPRRRSLAATPRAKQNKGGSARLLSCRPPEITTDRNGHHNACHDEAKLPKRFGSRQERHPCVGRAHLWSRRGEIISKASKDSTADDAEQRIPEGCCYELLEIVSLCHVIVVSRSGRVFLIYIIYALFGLWFAAHGAVCQQAISSHCRRRIEGSVLAS
jgi:hypothetical protein